MLVIAANLNQAESLTTRLAFTQRPSTIFQNTSTTRNTSLKQQHQNRHFSRKQHLQMSSIPEEDDYHPPPIKSQFLEPIKEALPPLPEDPTALSGDVLALFVYSYLDHTIHDICAEAARMDIGEYLTAVNSANAPSLPVWFDVTHINEFGHWLADSSSITSYAPVIASGGLAFVVMASCWILSGYFSGAFLMKNTLDCDGKNAMLVTGKTWVVMAVLMVGLALGSDALWGQLDTIRPLSDPARGGLTKADADYIFDSLSVLAFWRWMFNYLLGYR